jgi:hypothetical protein
MVETNANPRATVNPRELKRVILDRWPHGPVREFALTFPDVPDRGDALVRLQALLAVIRATHAPP